MLNIDFTNDVCSFLYPGTVISAPPPKKKNCIHRGTGHIWFQQGAVLHCYNNLDNFRALARSATRTKLYCISRKFSKFISEVQLPLWGGMQTL